MSDSPGQVESAPQLLAPHPAPEFLQPLQTIFRLVAGDQAGVDGADRRADDPIRLDAGLMQGLIDARLIGAERAAALEDEDGLALLLRRLLRARRPAPSAPAINRVSLTSSILFTLSSHTAPRAS